MLYYRGLNTSGFWFQGFGFEVGGASAFGIEIQRYLEYLMT